MKKDEIIKAIVCEELEEEMEKFIETFGWGKTKHLAEKELISTTARHFAQWQKEQMMKEAVETWMIEGSMFEPEYIKRKVIIIKEDKQ